MHAQAIYNLSICHLKGQGVPKDLSNAAFLSEKAAELGHLDAQFNMALFYEKGDGVTKDLSKAAFWYHKAAEQGDQRAMTALKRLEER